jgi:hypothetical protein
MALALTHRILLLLAGFLPAALLLLPGLLARGLILLAGLLVRIVLVLICHPGAPLLNDSTRTTTGERDIGFMAPEFPGNIAGPSGLVKVWSFCTANSGVKPLRVAFAAVAAPPPRC